MSGLTLALRRILMPALTLVLIAVGEPARAGNAEVVIERDVIALQSAAGHDAQSLLGTAVAAFYQQRRFAPAWADAMRRKRLHAALSELRSDGLDPLDYQPDADVDPSFEPAGDEEIARRDVVTTQRVLRALMHLHRGKVDPAQLDPHWNFPRDRFDPATAAPALEAALQHDGYLALLESARPSHWLYSRLRLALRRLYEIQVGGGWPALPEGPTLKPGDISDVVPVLRERLRITGEWHAAAVQADADPRVYDATLEAAVREFQTEQYLDADGSVGRTTRAALNVSVDARIAQLRVNLERARWLLSRSQPRFVLVDIAGYRALYFRDEKVVWRGRVQVGRPYRRTPSFETAINYLTLNPTWTVPPTILREDILPKLRKDPGYLERQHLRIIDRQGRDVPRAGVDLTRPGSWQLRQDAGPDNALGRVAIRFPNPYSVYMHDTPSQALFDQRQRAFSSGCIRVERAPELARLLLDDEAQWNAAAFDAALASGETRNVALREPVPLLITYWTVDVGPDGKFAFRPDIYDRDPAVLQALDAAN